MISNSVSIMFLHSRYHRHSESSYTISYLIYHEAFKIQAAAVIQHYRKDYALYFQDSLIITQPHSF